MFTCHWTNGRQRDPNTGFKITHVNCDTSDQITNNKAMSQPLFAQCSVWFRNWGKGDCLPIALPAAMLELLSLTWFVYDQKAWHPKQTRQRRRRSKSATHLTRVCWIIELHDGQNTKPNNPTGTWWAGTSDVFLCDSCFTLTPRDIPRQLHCALALLNTMISQEPEEASAMFCSLCMLP